MGLEIPFEIGDWVEFAAVVKSKRDRIDEGYVAKYLIRNPCETRRIGKVVGVVRRYYGKIYPGTSGGFPEYEAEPPEFVPTQFDLLVKVAESWIARPMECFFYDVKKIDPPDPDKFPILLGCKWTEGEKRSQSEEMMDWPRDHRGRWMKFVEEEREEGPEQTEG